MKPSRYPLVAAAVAATLMSTRLLAADAVTDAAAAASAATADVTADNSELNEVIVTGTRASNIKAVDSAAPVQVIGKEELSRVSSTPDLIQTLQTLIPSLDTTTPANGIGDLANNTLQAALRYLSPNDTLILINGKRRHTTGNINVGSGNEFGGGAGADLNFIPADAIDHVEVLTDGAAAQYGSDAIAGVINIILKKSPSGGNLQASYGGYQDGGGKTDDVSGNIGFTPYDGAYINFTGEFRNHGHTNRGVPLDYTTDAANLQNPNPALYPYAGIQPIDINVLNSPNYPVVNISAGDARYQTKLATVNSGFKINDNIEFYAFGTYGQKSASALQNYRLPHIAAYTNANTGDTTYQYPYGFTPTEDTEETDYGLTAGFRGVALGWNWDVSNTYGRDYIDFYTRSSSNTVAYADTGYSPTDFYDGSFKTTQWTVNLDLDRDFNVGLAGPLNVALGAEQRRDAFVTGAGIPLSYEEGGAAAFQGFSTTDAGGHSRTNSAGYVDFSAKIIGGLRLDIAGRYEHYSDFGDARSGKFTARYDFSPAFAIRGTISNGFRAPTVAEEYYTKSSTSPVSTGVQLAANSPAAALFGLGKLQPETSVNYSFGAVFTPTPQFTATLDLYQINLNHRIISTNSFTGEQENLDADGLPYADTSAPTYSLVNQALALNGNQLNPAILSTSVNFFTNGVDTKTQGADLVLDYASNFGRFGQVDWSLKANYNKNSITGIRSQSAVLASLPTTAANAYQTQVIDATGLSGLTTALPKYTLQFGPVWTLNRLTVNLREIIRGSTSAIDSAPGVGGTYYYNDDSGVIPITNLDIAYDVAKSVKLSVGANNLFNRYPRRLAPEVQAYEQSLGLPFAVNDFTTSPIGVDGGYYYVKAEYTF